MGLYLKKFENHTDYEAFTATTEFIKPNVSYCEQENEVHYNPYVHDYSQDYLTFEALQDGTFQFTNAINYSIDNGDTWVALAANTATPTINAGNRIMWKAELTPSTNIGIGTFSSTGNYNTEGNIMSLLYGDNFSGQTSLSNKDYAFSLLFIGNQKLVNVQYLLLPATTLANNCYMYMFMGCTSLTIVPLNMLPATTLANDCYFGMFNGCTSLTTAPELPATTLANNCYSSMFMGCTSLTTVPSNMLPATTLLDYCYFGMFQGCTSLTNAPVLSATTLSDYCYDNMFNGCTSLTTAPTLPATTLSTRCYYMMFNNCILLTNITCLATDISADGCTIDWVNGVQTTSGTFIKAAGMEDWTTGNDGIPNGWTVETASA